MESTNVKINGLMSGSVREAFENNIYTMLKDKVIEVLDYSKTQFTNQEILTSIRNAVNIEKEMEEVLPKKLCIRDLIFLGKIADITEILANVTRLVKGIVPIMTLLECHNKKIIDVYRDSIMSGMSKVKTLEEMLDFLSQLQHFTIYFSTEEIDQAIENHSWSEEERKVLNGIIQNLNNNTIITTPEEDTKMDIQNNGFGLRVSKEVIRKLVEEKFFNEELSKMYSRHQKISILTELIKWSAANAPSNNYRFVGASEGSTTIITVYKLGEVLYSFQIDGTSISEVEIDTEFENLLKLGY